MVVRGIFTVHSERNISVSERLSDQKMDKITKMDRSNTKGPRKEAIGSMKDETRNLLYEFYKPFNEELARLLHDQRFNFGIR